MMFQTHLLVMTAQLVKKILPLTVTNKIKCCYAEYQVDESERNLLEKLFIEDDKADGNCSRV